MSFPLPPLPKRTEADYEVGELLGRGNFVSVYQALEQPTGKSVALKIVDRYRCHRLKKSADLVMEKHCLRRTNHPNIVKMSAHFTDTLCVWVVMEECLGGELWDLVKTVGCPDKLARHYMAQVLNAIEYLRQLRIVHRDLKAENVMLTGTGVVKIIDFGTAKDLENPQIKGSGNASRRKVFEDYVGTPQFMPPEVIENKFTDFRSDTWSLGCLIYQVLAGLPPFHAASEYLIFQRIMELDLQFPPAIHPDALDLIKRVIVKDPDYRLGAHDLRELKDHAYFAGVVFEGLHLRAAPVPSLADLCLRKIGRNIKEYLDQFSSLASLPHFTPEMGAQLERMRVVHKWQDDCLPPPDEC